jgi:hypothetical protein
MSFIMILEVFLGSHYMSDCIVGAVIGIANLGIAEGASAMGTEILLLGIDMMAATTISSRFKLS